MTRRPDWRGYWSEVDEPGRRQTVEADVRLHADELKLLFPDRIGMCLELGCGEGSLYRYFRTRFEDYVGVDFSPAMLRRFGQELSPVKLICADASNLPLGRFRCDFAVSVGVLQYLDEVQFRRNLQQLREMLVDGGTYVIGHIPDAQLRLHYYSRGLRSQEKTRLLGGLRTAFRVFVLRKHDGLGRWYSRRRIWELAAEEGFECKTFGSLIYEYRFSAVLTKKPRP